MEWAQAAGEPKLKVIVSTNPAIVSAEPHNANPVTGEPVAGEPVAGEQPPAKQGRSGLVRWFFAALGLGLFAWTIRRIGPATLLNAAIEHRAVIGIAALLEATRICLEGLSSWSALGTIRTAKNGSGESAQTPQLRWLPKFFVSQFAAHAVLNSVPAGRPVAEGLKANLLRSTIGGARAGAMVAMQQVNLFHSLGIFCSLAVVAALVLQMPWWLIIAFGANTLVLLTSAAGMGYLLRHPTLAAWLGKRIPSINAKLAAYQKEFADSPHYAVKPILWLLLGRLALLAEFTIVGRSIGIDLDAFGWMTVLGIQSLAGAVGMFVPGQLGATEAMMASAGGALTAASHGADQLALLALLLRIPQYSWVIIGFIVLIAWPDRSAGESKSP